MGSMGASDGSEGSEGKEGDHISRLSMPAPSEYVESKHVKNDPFQNYHHVRNIGPLNVFHV